MTDISVIKNLNNYSDHFNNNITNSAKVNNQIPKNPVSEIYMDPFKRNIEEKPIVLNEDPIAIVCEAYLRYTDDQDPMECYMKAGQILNYYLENFDFEPDFKDFFVTNKARNMAFEIRDYYSKRLTYDILKKEFSEMSSYQQRLFEVISKNVNTDGTYNAYKNLLGLLAKLPLVYQRDQIFERFRSVFELPSESHYEKDKDPKQERLTFYTKYVHDKKGSVEDEYFFYNQNNVLFRLRNPKRGYGQVQGKMGKHMQTFPGIFLDKFFEEHPVMTLTLSLRTTSILDGKFRFHDIENIHDFKD